MASLGILASAGLRAQDYPSSWYGAGAARAGSSTTGWASAAVLMSKTQGLYSFSTQDVSLSKSHQLQESTRTGLGIVLRQFPVKSAIVNLVCLGDAGAVVSSAAPPGVGSIAKFAWGGSGGVIVQFSKTSHFSAAAFVRRLSLATGQQTVYEIGLGYISKP